MYSGRPVTGAFFIGRRRSSSSAFLQGFLPLRRPFFMPSAACGLPNIGPRTFPRLPEGTGGFKRESGRRLTRGLLNT